MASPQSNAPSGAGGNTRAKNEQITFRFCSECSNMLYPAEDKDAHKLQYTCRTCQYTEEAESSCIFRNELNTSAGETAGVTQDVASDPTVGSFHPAFSTVRSVSPATQKITEQSDEGVDQPMLCMTCDTLICCARCGASSAGILLRKYPCHAKDSPFHLQSSNPASTPDTRLAQFHLNVGYLLPEDPFSEYDEQLMEEDDVDDDDDISRRSSTMSTDSTFSFAEPVGMEADLVNTGLSFYEPPATPRRAQDGALPRSTKECPQCRHTEAVFFQSQERKDDTGMQLFYVCCDCGHIFN